MTTLAIIGSGIAGRSLIYTLAKEKKTFSKILLFGSESMAKACSYRSTAVVAPRGLSPGHSELGDLLIQSYENFEFHFEHDRPLGVEKVMQITAAQNKLEEFKTRYPRGQETKDFSHENLYAQVDDAYLIDPTKYLDYLLDEAKSFYGDTLKVIDDFIIETGDDGFIFTQLGTKYQADKIVFASGVYNRYWLGLAPESKLKTIKCSQGSYFEFNDVVIPKESFSLTLDGHNYIWNKKEKRLLIGSTTLEVNHELAPMLELSKIHAFFSSILNLPVPEMVTGKVCVGLREKAQKRSPYYFQEGNRAFMGGFYKNGYTLGLTISKNLARHFL